MLETARTNALRCIGSFFVPLRLMPITDVCHECKIMFIMEEKLNAIIGEYQIGLITAHEFISQITDLGFVNGVFLVLDPQ